MRLCGDLARAQAGVIGVSSSELAVALLVALAAAARARVVAADARDARGAGAEVQRRGLLADAAVVVRVRVLHVADDFRALLDGLRGLGGLLLRLHAHRQQ